MEAVLARCRGLRARACYGSTQAAAAAAWEKNCLDKAHHMMLVVEK
jgi:hypothetical protein